MGFLQKSIVKGFLKHFKRAKGRIMKQMHTKQEIKRGVFDFLFGRFQNTAQVNE